MALSDPAPATNTTPLVQADGLGGHVPVVRQDRTPTQTYEPAQQAILDTLREAVELLADIRLETVATRLAVQEMLNAGGDTQHDFREQAQTIIDRSETEEP